MLDRNRREPLPQSGRSYEAARVNDELFNDVEVEL
jgi:hypothetical protein